jgi:hypothetical protein
MYRLKAAVTGELEFTVFVGGGLVRAVESPHARHATALTAAKNFNKRRPNM